MIFTGAATMFAKLKDLGKQRQPEDATRSGLVADAAAIFEGFKVCAVAVTEEVRDSWTAVTRDDLKPLREAVSEKSRKLTVTLSETASKARPQIENIKEEFQFVAITVYVETRSVIGHLNETQIRPLREALGEEWHELAADEGLLGDSVRTAAEIVTTAGTEAAETGKKAIDAVRKRAMAALPDKKRSAVTPQAVWRSLKQAKELVFDEHRSRQFDEMDQPGEGTARAHLAKAEETVNRYMKIAASSVAVSVAGVAFFPALKLVSAGMILYAAFPVFRGTYTDLVHKRRVTIKLLDSVAFIGLIAGGYFVICSVTATIFHASMKMMLKTEDRSRHMIANMFGQQPRSVLVLVDGRETEIRFEALKVGDILVVHAGQMIAIDGLVSAGTAAVDQHILTGEAQPAEKGPGDRVFAATMLLAGRIEVLVEKTGAETAAAQIRDILANSTDFRTAIQARWVDVADKTVLPTLGLAGLALAFINPAGALGVINSNYVAVMKVASPLGMLNFLQRASQAGILIKDGRALESAGKIDTVVFDKTGTLTQAHPHVGEIHIFNGVDTDDLLTCAAAVELNQSHPIAQAIVQAAAERKLTLPPLEDARYEIGFGIEARVNGRLVRVGSARYMSMQRIAIPAEFEAAAGAIHGKGASIVYVAFEDKAAGALELRPTLRPEAKGLIGALKQRGLKIYIISGDQKAPTEALATELGIDHYFAEVLPQDKSRLVGGLQKEGRHVCFVGDGINDAIALKNADVSVSLRGASSLATNTAQIILMDESLKQLGQLFQIADEYNANLKTLMRTTFGPGLVSLAGVFFFGTGTGVALVLFNMSMVAGVINAIWPALRTLEDEEPAAVQAEAGSPAHNAETVAAG